MVAMTGCTSHTEYGKCIGAFDEKAPGLKYNTSGWNIAMAIVFFETIVVPAVVISSDIQCPVERK